MDTDWPLREIWEAILLVLAGITVLGGLVSIPSGLVSVLALLFMAAVGVVLTPFQSRLNTLVADADYQRRFVCVRFLIPWANLLPVSASAKLRTNRPASQETVLHILWFLGAVALPGTVALFILFSVVDNVRSEPIAALIAGAFTVFAFRAWLFSFRQAENAYKSAESRLAYSSPSAYASPFRRAILWTCGSIAVIIVAMTFPYWTIFSDRF